MRKIVISALVATAALSSVPASAQAWRGPAPVQRQLQNDINQLERRIDNAAARRTISQREAAGLRREAGQLQRLYARFSRNGLDRREVAQLQRGVGQLQQRLRVERRDVDRRRG
ncbi:hypothetical protein [Sphingosinicella terrae]|uniref:hypothetical protein n=1 Tax=Sphingosinicella terrae TaxID=2172047 RepID=UPI002548CE93|nr:hypothetical protein [Sphingosinicella terrae]